MWEWWSPVHPCILLVSYFIIIIYSVTIDQGIRKVTYSPFWLTAFQVTYIDLYRQEADAVLLSSTAMADRAFEGDVTTVLWARSISNRNIYPKNVVATPIYCIVILKLYRARGVWTLVCNSEYVSSGCDSLCYRQCARFQWANKPAHACTELNCTTYYWGNALVVQVASLVKL